MRDVIHEKKSGFSHNQAENKCQQIASVIMEEEGVVNKLDWSCVITGFTDPHD